MKVITMNCNRIVSLLLIIGCSSFISCKTYIHSDKEYFEWINNYKNGCALNKKCGVVEFELKYLHPEYLAHRDAEGIRANYDSLVSIYKGSRSFVFTVKSSTEDKNFDVLYLNASNPTEYNKRLMTLQYELQSCFYISNGMSVIYPKLCISENSYGISSERRVILVFDMNGCGGKDKDVTICYTDKLFGNGILEFKVLKSDMDSKLRFDFN
jgi:hypothetical protein